MPDSCESTNFSFFFLVFAALFFVVAGIIVALFFLCRCDCSFFSPSFLCAYIYTRRGRFVLEREIGMFTDCWVSRRNYLAVSDDTVEGRAKIRYSLSLKFKLRNEGPRFFRDSHSVTHPLFYTFLVFRRLDSYI